MKLATITIFLFLFDLNLARSEEFCNSMPSSHYSGLVHPFIEKLSHYNIERYLKFDNEDMEGYIESAHEDVHVEIYVKEKLAIVANGIDDYYKKFDFILQSFIERDVYGYHVLTPANYTLHTDGSLTLSFDYNHYDRPKTTPNAEKSWKSTGYYICHWIPIRDDEDKKFELKNWKLKNYFIHVVTTSDDFGSSNDGCKELC